MSWSAQDKRPHPQPRAFPELVSNLERYEHCMRRVMTIPIPLQEALRDSNTSGTFVDTNFWVFSKHRPRSKRIGEPKALFINRHVAKRVPRLCSRAALSVNRSRLLADPLTVLDEKKTKENLRAGFPSDRKPYTTDYDYEDDSDLEDDDDEEALDDEPASAPQVIAD